MLKLISKIRSKVYAQVIETKVPIRFYWNEDGSFDGIEFNCENLSRYQLTLLKIILDTFLYTSSCISFVHYLSEKHKEEFVKLLEQYNNDDDIPQAFLDAFKDGNNE